MKKFIENSIFASNLTKTLLYSIEYKMLFQLSRCFSYFVTPPFQEKDKNLLKFLEAGVIKIHTEDAKNISEGIYPIEVIRPKSPFRHIQNIPMLFLDSLKISRRRKLNIKKDFNIQSSESAEAVEIPDYLKRNYHFQTDGYFSEQSAKLYEHQVEILFSGTAGPMRRMLIKMIKEKLNHDRPIKILEIGAGVGSASLDFSKALNYSSYTVTDVSDSYLNNAQKRLNGPNFQFVQTPGELLPFEDNSFDLVFSVFLFHELPVNIREKVLHESFRVLNAGGIVAICDSLQLDDEPILNKVLKQFPLDYHEPFYISYINWNVKTSLENACFTEVSSDFKLLSKYWTARKQ